MKLAGIALLSWIVLTTLRALVFVLWNKVIGRDWPRGYWVVLAPQIVLVFLFSWLFVGAYYLPSANDWLFLGACWLVYTLIFEFVGVLVFEKGGLALLFQGWKLWKGNIWVLVLLSHLFAPYLFGLLLYA